VKTLLKPGSMAVFLAAVCLRPVPSLACAACYGQSDSPMASGMNWGILSLLGVILLVLGGVALSFISMARRAAAVAAAEAAAARPGGGARRDPLVRAEGAPVHA